MAVQFAPREGSFGASIGGALGSAVGGGINSLIEKKIADLKKRSGIEERKTTYKNLGLPEWIGELPDELQQTLLKEYEFAPPQEKQAMNQQLEQIGQQYWSPQAEQQQQFQGQQPQQQMPRAPMGQETPEYTQAPAEDFGKYESKIPGLNTILSSGKGMQVSPEARAETQAFPQLGRGTMGQPGPTESMQPAYKEPSIEKLASPVLARKGTQQAQMAQEMAAKKAEIAQQETLRKEKIKEDQLARKETQKYYDSVLEKAKEARESSTRLNKMERLVNKGGLPVAAFYSLFNKLEESIPPQYGAPAGAGIGGVIGGIIGSVAPGVGTAIGAGVGSAIGGGIGGLISPVATMLKYGQRLTSPNTEEFEKLSNQFIKGAKAVFGNRITDSDLKVYMAQIPTLANTDAGKMAIIQDMKIANEGEIVREKYMKQIIKENNGKRPAGLAIQVEERAKKELDLLAKRFINI